MLRTFAKKDWISNFNDTCCKYHQSTWKSIYWYEYVIHFTITQFHIDYSKHVQLKCILSSGIPRRFHPIARLTRFLKHNERLRIRWRSFCLLIANVRLDISHSNSLCVLSIAFDHLCAIAQSMGVLNAATSDRSSAKFRSGFLEVSSGIVDIFNGQFKFGRWRTPVVVWWMIW